MLRRLLVGPLLGPAVNERVALRYLRAVCGRCFAFEVRGGLLFVESAHEMEGIGMIGLDFLAFVLGVVFAVQAVLLSHKYYKLNGSLKSNGI